MIRCAEFAQCLNAARNAKSLIHVHPRCFYRDGGIRGGFQVAFKNIVVAGGGVLGSQIALQSGYCGFNVTIWLRSEGSIGRCRPKLEQDKALYLQSIDQMSGPGAKTPGVWAYGIASPDDFDPAKCKERIEKSYADIKLETDLAKAVQDADLVIESVAENKDQKIEFYEKMAPLLPEKTILATNSSTLLPSVLAESTGRPKMFLALHFANHIWLHNLVEVMAQPLTEQKYFDEVFAFAKQIRMQPVALHKEKAGYLLNSMLVPLLTAAQDLYATGISDPSDIDMAWRLGTGAPLGPFQMLDVIGLTTADNIVQATLAAPPQGVPYDFKAIHEMLQKYIKEGKLGVASGEGFYKYTK